MMALQTTTNVSTLQDRLIDVASSKRAKKRKAKVIENRSVNGERRLVSQCLLRGRRSQPEARLAVHRLRSEKRKRKRKQLFTLRDTADTVDRIATTATVHVFFCSLTDFS